MDGTAGVIDLDLMGLPELDLFGPEFAGDPAGTVGRLREQHGMARSIRGIEILTYERGRALLADQRTQSSMRDYYVRELATPAVLDYIDGGLLAWIEGERHARIRAVMERAFSLRSVDVQRRTMRLVADRLVARLVGAGGGDFVAEFSDRYPLEVLATLIGVPVADIPRFGRATADMNALGAVPLGPEIPRLEAAIGALTDYVGQLIDERSATPSDDLISALIEAQASLGQLSRRELVLNIINLLMAGHDTTKLQLASCVYELSQAQGGWERLRQQPAFAARAVEESLRFSPAVQSALRVPQEEIECAGVAVPAGTNLVVNIYAANRDPAVFEDPDRFDPDRARANRHLAFGRGQHVCIGNTLARAEMEEALAALATQVADVRLLGEVSWSGPADTLAGPVRLPLEMRPLL